MFFSAWLSFSAGPGAYNIFDYGLAQESIKKAVLESTRKGAFGSSASRSPLFVNKSDMHVPGPGQYKVGPGACVLGGLVGTEQSSAICCFC